MPAVPAPACSPARLRRFEGRHPEHWVPRFVETGPRGGPGTGGPSAPPQPTERGERGRSLLVGACGAVLRVAPGGHLAWLWGSRPRRLPGARLPASPAVVFWLRRAGTAGHHRCATGFQERPRLRGWGHGPLARGTRGRCGSSHTQALPLPRPPERAVTDAACSQERARPGPLPPRPPRPVLSIRDAWANGSTARATAMPHPSRHLGDCLTSGTNTVCENTGLPLPRVLFAPRIRAGGPGGYRVYPP